MRRFIASLILAASTALAAPPTYTLDLDVQRPRTDWKLDVFQNNTYTLQVDFKERGTAWDATGYTALFRWGTNYLDSASMSSTTGTVSTSSATFTLDATQTATNGEWFAEILVQTNGAIRTWNQGWYKVRKSPGAGSPSALDMGAVVNYGSVASYAAVAASGPYRAGTNIVFSSNADGSQDINSVGSPDATKLPLSGGTMTGDLTMSASDIRLGSDQYLYLDGATGDYGMRLNQTFSRIYVRHAGADGSYFDGGGLQVAGDVNITSGLSVTNLTFEYWAPSNRWAAVERYTGVTNVTFISP